MTSTVINNRPITGIFPPLQTTQASTMLQTRSSVTEDQNSKIITMNSRNAPRRCFSAVVN